MEYPSPLTTNSTDMAGWSDGLKDINIILMDYLEQKTHFTYNIIFPIISGPLFCIAFK